MAILSAFNIVRGLALFHMTLAYLFLTNPAAAADQNLVWLFGESMQLSEVSTFVKPTSATALIAVLLAFFGLSDLTSVTMDEELAYNYWGNQAPVRLVFLFALTAYSYLPPSGTFRGAVGDTLKNRVVFTFGFFEVVMWFWVFVTLRDDRRQAADKIMERRRAEAERL